MQTIAALLSVVIVSLISLLGALFLVLGDRPVRKLISITIAVSTGVMLGSVFLDLLPESVALTGSSSFPIVLSGVLSFFVLEKLISWHHHIEGDHANGEKPIAYLTLFGDSIHNFVDGTIIAAAYMVSMPLGLTTTLAVIAHEIPHELSDFTILLHAGLSNSKALFYNLISALTAVLGAIVVLFLFTRGEKIEQFLIPFAAGNFLYIGASDLIPELHKRYAWKTSVLQFIAILAGVAVIPLVQRFFGP